MSGRPPIWVISLERATERRSFVHQVFGSLGVQYEVLDAVDGHALGQQDLRVYSEWRTLFHYGTGLGRGPLACALSHLRAYEKMIDEDLPEVVIVEDDVRPHPAFVTVLDERQRLPTDWDVVTFLSLFEWSTPVPVTDGRIAEDRTICTYQRTPMGAQAYLITQSAARRVLDVAYPVCLPADELLFRRRPAGLSTYGVEPTTVAHEAFASEIHGAPMAAKTAPALLRPLRGVVRFAGKVERRLRSTQTRARSS